MKITSLKFYREIGKEKIQVRRSHVQSLQSGVLLRQLGSVFGKFMADGLSFFPGNS